MFTFSTFLKKIKVKIYVEVCHALAHRHSDGNLRSYYGDVGWELGCRVCVECYVMWRMMCESGV